MIKIQNDWQPIMEEAANTESYQSLKRFLIDEYEEHIVYPPKEDIWTAFEWTPYTDVKVVIIGQDPYHGPNQAHGLSFSVKESVKIPPSLRNIFKELENDLNYPPVNHGYLKKWAKQGVLMLNTVLTVRAHTPNSHKNKGWEEVTNHAIEALNDLDHAVVFLLWGRHAQQKKDLINTNKHFVIESSHPSPFSARHSFFGSKPFSKVNALLEADGQTPIDWKLDNI
ncbi:uracil-DNA glycosylase [Aerococcaceae bacterium INB8]|uniref:Uracil-DNA glycosylase n=1 Tax=Ruoffia halotolerans TaxID=2748684 RepID=A0A839A4G9_9LACT|nr:uracil-DNA glycosylase [Ruoffia halotolerans]MBA5728720.1 uracil-DNA glycosylase [Ruoffia halotolerans]